MHSFPPLPSLLSPLPLRTQSAVCADRLRPGGCGSGRSKKNKNKNKKELFIFSFLVVAAILKTKKKISVFGFQSPSSPSSVGFAGKAARRRRFFGLVPLVTHPSSIPLLGCLTPKFLIPKPFFPFSLRLIDVDGF
jgi:hypothetical protein